MPYRTDDPNFEDDDEFDEDWSDDANSDDSETNTIRCPRCGAQVYEDAPYCPHCDHDLADADPNDPDAIPPRKPLWIILGALACMYAFYRWILLR